MLYFRVVNTMTMSVDNRLRRSHCTDNKVEREAVFELLFELSNIRTHFLTSET